VLMCLLWNRFGEFFQIFADFGKYSQLILPQYQYRLTR
jgi:hypothetical protein